MVDHRLHLEAEIHRVCSNHRLELLVAHHQRDVLADVVEAAAGLKEGAHNVLPLCVWREVSVIDALWPQVNLPHQGVPR